MPTRYYFDRTDVDFARLEPGNTRSVCPYKGITSGYWSARIGDMVHTGIAWTYDYPAHQVAAIAGLIAFYNEVVDIFLDGDKLPRPRTHFISNAAGSGRPWSRLGAFGQSPGEAARDF